MLKAKSSAFATRYVYTTDVLCDPATVKLTGYTLTTRTLNIVFATTIYNAPASQYNLQMIKEVWNVPAPQMIVLLL